MSLNTFIQRESTIKSHRILIIKTHRNKFIKQNKETFEILYTKKATEKLCEEENAIYRHLLETTTSTDLMKWCQIIFPKIQSLVTKTKKSKEIIEPEEIKYVKEFQQFDDNSIEASVNIESIFIRLKMKDLGEVTLIALIGMSSKIKCSNSKLTARLNLKDVESIFVSKREQRCDLLQLTYKEETILNDVKMKGHIKMVNFLHRVISISK